MNFTRISRAVALASIAVLLLGCGASEPAAPQAVRRGFGERAAWARQSVLDSRLPAKVRAALEQLGMIAVAPDTGARTASTALPHTLAANHEYAGAGDAGYLSHSSNVTLGLNGMDLQPSGAVFPDSFAYLVYRVDDIAQALTTLEFSFGLLGPGAEIGVAAYDWTYGSLGHWAPLTWQPASSGMTVPLASQYISPGGDLVFAVFCLSPSQLELQSMVVGTDNTHPNYDELEPNNTTLTPNELPAIPFTGYRGNVGENGDYDGSTLDHFSFTGSVGEKYMFTFTPDTFAADVLFSAVDKDGYLVSIGSFDPVDGSAQLPVLITTNQVQPLIIQIRTENFSVPTDYTLDGVLVTPAQYDEIEDNDNEAQATSLAGHPFQVRGNLGQPDGFDSDFIDWFYFPMVTGEQHDFAVWYDHAKLGFDFFNNPPLLVDASGFVLAEGFDGAVYFAPDAVVFEMSVPIVDANNPPFFIKVSPVAGGSDYWLVSL